jgi:hypothetical protein
MALRIEIQNPDVGAQILIATLSRVWEKNPKMATALIQFLDKPPHTGSFTVQSQGHMLTSWKQDIVGMEKDRD